MKLQEFYELAIEAGIDADPRGRDAVEKELLKRASHTMSRFPVSTLQQTTELRAIFRRSSIVTARVAARLAITVYERAYVQGPGI